MATLPQTQAVEWSATSVDHDDHGVFLMGDSEYYDRSRVAAVVGFPEDRPRSGEASTSSAGVLTPWRKAGPRSASAVPVMANAVSTRHDQSARELLTKTIETPSFTPILTLPTPKLPPAAGSRLDAVEVLNR